MMIKAQELRIDNWVYVSNVGECQISGFDKIYNSVLPIVRNSEKEFKVTENLICGIVLTEEVFKQLISRFTNGSNRKNHKWVVFHNMHLDIYYFDNGNESYYYYNTNNLQSIKITYLHDFQNLIFALAKTELEFNP